MIDYQLTIHSQCWIILISIYHWHSLSFKIYFKVSFNSVIYLNKLLFINKYKIDVLNRSGVWQLTCACCGSHVGRTNLNFKIRFREHVRLNHRLSKFLVIFGTSYFLKPLFRSAYQPKSKENLEIAKSRHWDGSYLLNIETSL